MRQQSVISERDSESVVKVGDQKPRDKRNAGRQSCLIDDSQVRVPQVSAVEPFGDKTGLHL